MYNRLPHGAAPLQPIAPLQAASPVFDYPVQPMSAVPYAPSWEPYSVLAMVTMQLEYYFSIDNLCKDVFLRKHMDSKGFVFLTTIASFKRIQHLTQEFEVLRFACQESEVIEIVVGDDGIDRLRRKDGWEQWVLAMEERDEVARNDGPERFYRQQSQRFQPQPFAPRMMGMPPSTMSPPAFSPNGTQQAYGAFANPTPPTNGVEHPVMYPNESPLSAAVPDFAPSAQPTESEVLAGETTFTDEEVEKLQLVYNRKEESGSTGNEQRNSRRTFSNGSIDGRTIGEELHESQSREASPLTNGTSLPIAM
jgi:la-related protein 1